MPFPFSKMVASFQLGKEPDITLQSSLIDCCGLFRFYELALFVILLEISLRLGNR